MDDELEEEVGLEAEDDEALLDDPVVVRHIERAMSPYRGLLPAEAIAAMDDLLFVVLTTHPEVRPMVDRLRRAARVERSGARPSPAGRGSAGGAALSGEEGGCAEPAGGRGARSGRGAA
ncbi:MULTISPECIES: hypothetical protein [Sorangium]|uniref:Uncharacterized protein n=1 Tax=Sorangium cellulosum TaxID=56 RepID=A0A4P2QVA7_SORCE|nr:MULTISPECIES: hypothetical protein [Sorangium]AUX34349.1 uncharacterized protein SOCE836_065210 [Sorangium cellulosum]WCQ93666.1 hypothetical protein NQZ70_06418 [Sorangium sp. Soce836]